MQRNADRRPTAPHVLLSMTHALLQVAKKR